MNYIDDPALEAEYTAAQQDYMSDLLNGRDYLDSQKRFQEASERLLARIDQRGHAYAKVEF